MSVFVFLSPEDFDWAILLSSRFETLTMGTEQSILQTPKIVENETPKQHNTPPPKDSSVPHIPVYGELEEEDDDEDDGYFGQSNVYMNRDKMEVDSITPETQDVTHESPKLQPLSVDEVFLNTSSASMSSPTASPGSQTNNEKDKKKDDQDEDLKSTNKKATVEFEEPEQQDLSSHGEDDENFSIYSRRSSKRLSSAFVPDKSKKVTDNVKNAPTSNHVTNMNMAQAGDESVKQQKEDQGDDDDDKNYKVVAGAATTSHDDDGGDDDDDQLSVCDFSDSDEEEEEEFRLEYSALPLRSLETKSATLSFITRRISSANRVANESNDGDEVNSLPRRKEEAEEAEEEETKEAAEERIKESLKKFEDYKNEGLVGPIIEEGGSDSDSDSDSEEDHHHQKDKNEKKKKKKDTEKDNTQDMTSIIEEIPSEEEEDEEEVEGETKEEAEAAALVGTDNARDKEQISMPSSNAKQPSQSKFQVDHNDDETKPQRKNNDKIDITNSDENAAVQVKSEGDVTEKEEEDQVIKTSLPDSTTIAAPAPSPSSSSSPSSPSVNKKSTTRRSTSYIPPSRTTYQKDLASILAILRKPVNDTNYVDYAFSERQGKRSSMEDMWCFKAPLLTSADHSSSWFAGVYDGHGGKVW
jgi:hypothetical protein